MPPRKTSKNDFRDPKNHPGGTQKCFRRVPAVPFDLLQDHLETIPEPRSLPNPKIWIIVESSYEKSPKSFAHCTPGRSPLRNPLEPYIQEILTYYGTRAPRPKGSADSKGLRPTAADPRKHPGRRNARGREKIDRDGLRVIEISTD